MSTQIKTSGTTLAGERYRILPASRIGFKYGNFYGGTETESLANKADILLPAIAKVGSPTFNAASVTLSAANRLQTALSEQADLTVLVACKVAAGVTNAQLFGNFLNAGSPQGIGLFMTTATNMRGVACYDNAGAVTNGIANLAIGLQVDGITSNVYLWNLWALVVQQGVGHRLYNITTGTGPAALANTNTRRLDAAALRNFAIGATPGGATSGALDVSFVGLWSSAAGGGGAKTLAQLQTERTAFVNPGIAARGGAAV